MHCGTQSMVCTLVIVLVILYFGNFYAFYVLYTDNLHTGHGKHVSLLPSTDLLTSVLTFTANFSISFSLHIVCARKKCKISLNNIPQMYLCFDTDTFISPNPAYAINHQKTELQAKFTRATCLF